MDHHRSFGKSSFAPVDHLKPGRPARDDEERARLRAEIDARYTQPRKHRNPLRRIALLRLYDLENLFRASDVPDNGGWEHLTIAANHIAFTRSKPDAKVAAIVAWSRRFTPSIPADRAKLLAERIIANPRMPTADKLAWRLKLTMEKRTALGITTIGAIDMNKAERAALRKQKNTEAHRQSRAAKSGGKPRGRPSKGKPWEALGISRRTYYRRGTKMRPQHSLSSYAADGISCHLLPQPAAPASPPADASGSPTPVGLGEGRFGSVPASPLAPPSLREISSIMGIAPHRAIAFKLADMIRLTEVRP